MLDDLFLQDSYQIPPRTQGQGQGQSRYTHPLPLSLPQAEHGSQTEREVQQELGIDGKTQHQVFPARESHLPDVILCEENFIKTLNSGTPEYIESDVADRIKDLDLFDLVGRVMNRMSTPGSKSRGNTQWTVGISCGQAIQELKKAEDILAQFGTTLPAVLEGTLEEDGSIPPDVVEIFKLGYNLARFFKLLQTTPGYLDDNPELREELEIGEWLLTRSGEDSRGALSAILLAITAFEQRIARTSRTEWHFDDQNHEELSGAICASETRACGEEFRRRGLVFNGRKSLKDARIRRAACREKVEPCMKFIREKMEDYRKPSCPLERYFREGVGSEGLLLTQNKATGEIVGCALRAKPHLDKQGTYLASVVYAIIALNTAVPIDRSTEFLELLTLVGSLCNIYIFVTVLGMMQETWDPSLTATSRGGLLEYVITQMVRVGGCFNGGPGRRCMNFANGRTIPLTTFRKNCRAVATTLTRLMGEVYSGVCPNGTERRARAHAAITSLKSACTHMGELGGSHLVHVLSLFRAAPSYFLDHAIICAHVSTNKKGRNPAMDAYVGLEEEGMAKKGPALRSSKFSIVNRALVRVARVLLKDEYFTESQGENLGCEANRDAAAYDLWFGGQGFFRKRERCSPFSEWEYMVPTLPEGYDGTMVDIDEILDQVEFIKQEVALPRRVARPSSASDPLGSGCALWDVAVADSVLSGSVDMGTMPKKGTEEYNALEFTSTTIPSEALDQHPELLKQIKVAMLARRDGSNQHKDIMKRLNQISLLREIAGQVRDGSLKRSATDKKGKRTKRHKSSTPPSEIGAPFQPAKTRVLEGSVLDKGTSQEVDIMVAPTQQDVVQARLCYREFEESDGVRLDGFASYSKWEDFPACSLTKSTTPPLGYANSAISCGMKGAVPKLKMSKQRTKRSRNEQNVRVLSITHEKDTLYRAIVDFLKPDAFGVASVCRVRDAIAMSLCGVAVADPAGQELCWHFRTEELATRYIVICILCVTGTEKSRRRLFSSVVRNVRGIKDVARVMVVKPEGDISKEAKNQKQVTEDGHVWYYVMALGELTGAHNLVLAVPPAKPVKKDQVPKMSFIRLL